MKITKQLLFDEAATDKLIKGINTVADAVEATLGPAGSVVLIEGNPGQSNIITKDGVTVARSICLEDSYEDLGAALLKDASLRANELAGDGTTTTVSVARAMVNASKEKIIDTNRLEELGRQAEEYIQKNIVRKISTKEEYYSVALTSSNGDKAVAELVADAYDAVGANGVVLVEESKKATSELTVLDGFNVGYGYVHPSFITDPSTGQAVLHDPAIVIFKGEIRNFMPLTDFLESALGQSRGAVIVAKGFNQEVIALLHQNKIQNGMQVCPVIHDENSDVLEDLAVKCGCSVAPEGMNVTPTAMNIGSAEKILVNSKQMTVINGNSDPERLQEAKSHLENVLATEADHDQVQLVQERLARLVGGVAIIKVGGPTIAYMKETKDRIDDAVCALASARKHGVVPGGGNTLAHVAERFNEMESLGKEGGYRVVDNALMVFVKGLYRPFQVINGLSSRPQELGVWSGKDHRTQQWGNMYDLGIVDPAMAAILAVRHAVAVCSLVCRTNCAAINTPKGDAYAAREENGL